MDLKGNNILKSRHNREKLSPEELRELIIDILKEKNINVTEQRISVLEFLYLDDSHPTAEEVYYAMLKTDDKVARATVYNTINIFEEKGLIRVVGFNENVKRYDLYLDEHAHFVCNYCQSIYDVEIPELLRDSKIFDLPDNVVVETQSIIIRGKCSNCINTES